MVVAHKLTYSLGDAKPITERLRLALYSAASARSISLRFYM